MPELNYESLKFWGDVVWRAGTLIGLIWLAVQQRSRGNTKKLERHEERLERIDRDLIWMNGKIDGQPTHDDLQLIHNRISDVKTSLNELHAGQEGLTTAVNGLTKAVDRIYDVEFSKKKE